MAEVNHELSCKYDNCTHRHTIKYNILDEDTMKDIIYCEKVKGYFHSKCFRHFCEDKSKSKRKDVRETYGNILKDFDTEVEKCHNDALKRIKKVPTNKPKGNPLNDGLNEFLKDKYDVVLIPQYFWIKINDLCDHGIYKGENVGIIPREHLLDMWKRKFNYLQKTRLNKMVKGNKINSVAALNYDLAILINKYNSYIEWLRKEELKALEYQNNQKDVEVSKFIKGIKQPLPNNNDDDDDILSLVDEIFGL